MDQKDRLAGAEDVIGDLDAFGGEYRHVWLLECRLCGAATY